MVEIFFIDYGNTATVPMDNMLLLHKQFAKLEAQAIPSRYDVVNNIICDKIRLLRASTLIKKFSFVQTLGYCTKGTELLG